MSAPRNRGQASIELLAALPLLVLMTLALWQAVVAVRAAALSAAAARSAARAFATGADPVKAARTKIPTPDARRAKVATHDDGSVTVSVAVRSVLGGAELGALASSARFEAQR
ncbi:MAG: pilus assembly protein [Actinomycetes bacterium]